MSERTPGIQRDVAVVLRYRWFILSVFAVAVLAALFFAFASPLPYSAAASVEIRVYDRGPVIGSRFPINFNDYYSDSLRERTALRAAIALKDDGYDVSEGTLLSAVSQTIVAPLGTPAYRQLDFATSNDSEATAVAYVNAWADAFITEANIFRERVADAQVMVLRRAADETQTALQSVTKALNEAIQGGAIPVQAGQLVEERARAARALNRLRAIQSSGQTLTPVELQLAIADIFEPGAAPQPTDIATLTAGLNLRIAALDREITAYTSSDSATQTAQARFADVLAAQKTYDAAEQQLLAAQAARIVPYLDAVLLSHAQIAGTRGIGLVGLLGAAGMFGIAVSIVGAFVLDFASRHGPRLPRRGGD